VREVRRPRRGASLVVAMAAVAGLAATGFGCRDEAHASGPRPLLGKDATATALPAVDGDTLRAFATRLGRPVLVSLWASWCAPCLEEMPTLEAFAATHAEALAITAINVDNVETDRPAIDEALRRVGTKLPLGVAPPGAGALVDDLGARWNGVLPYHVLLDRHGAVLAAFSGGFVGAEAEAEFAAKVLAKLPAGGR
jgi:thiol-disulfide isomerase/thioredoxin